MMLQTILCGARRQLLRQGLVVRNIIRIRIKDLWRSRLLSDINQSYMGRKNLAATATLDSVVVKVFLSQRDRGNTLRMLKHSLKGLSSLLHLTST